VRLVQEADTESAETSPVFVASRGKVQVSRSSAFVVVFTLSKEKTCPEVCPLPVPVTRRYRRRTL